MKIHVTQDHINNGRPYCHTCPIALALNERVPIPGEWFVTSSFAQSGLHSAPHSLPRSAQRFIRRFDNGKHVEPFNFIIKGL